MADLEHSVRRVGGVARMTTLQSAGHSRHHLRRALDAATPYSDSGLETLLRTRLRWLDVRILAQAWIEGHRVDFLIGERLVVQIDGGHHVGGQRVADNAHDAALLVRGYQVIRVGYRQVVEDWPAVQEVITRAVAQGLHRR
ncbi:endonuclease domain-containing protein [Agromyces aurantiacus]|uniref:Endonuclease domain-containing protein n=1 Tax=Agromyces aurantiacus TaxID=165814 RepID=A0ABV9R9I8_9MICO|nr:DUF559 domain-containing protein [Agromyces aurantiacus]MBM7504847.1 very-short-patch-repair endonuclease [Agromyces aurantiacus]